MLVALNAKDGSVAWQTKLVSGPLAAATIVNDLVFTAGLDGVILGFTVADGKQVFSYQAPAGINAQAAVSGDYIYFPAGGPLIPSSASVNAPAKASFAVVALKLGGEVQVQGSPVAGGAAGTPEATPEGSGVQPGPNSSTPTS